MGNRNSRNSRNVRPLDVDKVTTQTHIEAKNKFLKWKKKILLMWKDTTATNVNGVATNVAGKKNL